MFEMQPVIYSETMKNLIHPIRGDPAPKVNRIYFLDLVRNSKLHSLDEFREEFWLAGIKPKELF